MLTELELRIQAYLEKNHKGEENVVRSKSIEETFGIKGSDLRRMMNRLRRAAYPICSGANGYYYAAHRKDVEATVAQLNSRIAQMIQARNGLLLVK